MIVIRIEIPNPGPLVSLVSKACFNSGFYVQSFSLGNVGYIKFDKKYILSKQEEPSDFLVISDIKNIDSSLKHAKEKSALLAISNEKPKSVLAKKRNIKTYFINSNSPIAIFGALSKICPQISQKASRSVIGDSYIIFEEGFKGVKQ